MDNSISLSFLADLYLDGKSALANSDVLFFILLSFKHTVHTIHTSTYMHGASNLYYCCSVCILCDF